MKRIRLGAKQKVLVVLASLGTGAAVVYGCIPSPDTSDLPPYDAGVQINPDVFNIVSSFDANGSDAPQSEDAGNEDAGGDAGPGTGTITGVVIDYTEGNGMGVVPNATVSVLGQAGVAPVTTDLFGTFTLKNVTAGPVQINVGKATDATTFDIAYSTTQVVTTLGSGQTVNVFPVLHEGCFETVTLGSAPGVVAMSDEDMQCPYSTSGDLLVGRYAALAYSASSFTDPAVGTGAVFSGTARVEMIPIAFPQQVGGGTDYSWAVGLPGASTPLETIGAVQIRVIDTATGDPLAVRAGDSVGVTIGTSRAFTAGENFALTAYNGVTGTWSPVNPGDGGTLALTPGTVGSNTVGTATIVPTLTGSWLTASNTALPTSCITGTLNLPTGSPAAGVIVHGVGATYTGTATAVTNANGVFCLPVAAAPSDGGAQPGVEILAGELAIGNAPLATQGVANVSTQTGSCATPTGCSAIGSPITLAPLVGGCTSGTVTQGGGPTMPGTLNVLLQLSVGNTEGDQVSTSQEQAGIQTYAYIGQLTVPDGGGPFCAQSVPGLATVLADPSTRPTSACYAGPFSAPPVGAAPTCSTGGCADAGSLPYGNNCD